MKINKWSMYCNDCVDNNIFLLEDGVVPTTCPINESHSVKVGSFYIIESIEETNIVVQQKKTFLTINNFLKPCSNGNFSINILTSEKNYIKFIEFPYNIDLMTGMFCLPCWKYGDRIDVYAKKKEFNIEFTENALIDDSVIYVSNIEYLYITNQVTINSNTYTITALGETSITISPALVTNQSIGDTILVSNPSYGGLIESASTGDTQIKASNFLLSYLKNGDILLFGTSSTEYEVYNADIDSSIVTLSEALDDDFDINTAIYVKLYGIKNLYLFDKIDSMCGQIIDEPMPLSIYDKMVFNLYLNDFPEFNCVARMRMVYYT